MDWLELTIIITIVGVFALIAMSIYFMNQRSIRQFEQNNLNYRAELRQVSSQSTQEEPDLMQTLLKFAAENPDILNSLMAGLNKQNPPKLT